MMTTKSKSDATTVNLPVLTAAWLKLEMASDTAYGKAMAAFRSMFAGLEVGDQVAYNAREKAVKATTDKALETVTPEQRKAYVKRRRVYQQRIRSALKVEAATARVGGRQPVKGKGKGEESKDPLTACNAALATLSAHFGNLTDSDKIAVREAIAKIVA